MRICCGAIKTSPIASLQVEMGEMPIGLRCKYNLLNYWANIRGCSKDDHMIKNDMYSYRKHEKIEN